MTPEQEHQLITHEPLVDAEVRWVVEHYLAETRGFDSGVDVVPPGDVETIAMRDRIRARRRVLLAWFST